MQPGVNVLMWIVIMEKDVKGKHKVDHSVKIHIIVKVVNS